MSKPTTVKTYEAVGSSGPSLVFVRVKATSKKAAVEAFNQGHYDEVRFPDDWRPALTKVSVRSVVEVPDDSAATTPDCVECVTNGR